MPRAAARAGLVLWAVALWAGPAAAAETIRVGFMGPLTGIFAQAGKDMLDGLKMALEQVNYQAGGRKIELIEADTEGNAATAIAKYRKLVDHDKIHVMTGILLVNVGNSLVPLIERDQLPTLFLTTPDDLTKRKIAKWILRSNFSASQIMHPLGDYAARTLKYRRVATIAMDNGFGHEEVGGFQRCSRTAAAAWSRRSGSPSTRSTSRPTSPRSPRTWTRSARSSWPARRCAS